jgi:hypothetical protein
MSDDTGLIGRWSPRIGDPSVMGWITVVAYFVTAWSCFAAARSRCDEVPAPEDARRERWVWFVLAVGFTLLGINKQLDLQSAFTEIGRLLARRQGWYAERHGVQVVFIAAMAATGLLAAAGAVRAAFGTCRAARLAVAGAILLIGFVVLRAASFHHVDMFLGARWLGVKANWALELGGIAIVLVAARLHRRSAARRRSAPA